MTAEKLVAIASKCRLEPSFLCSNYYLRYSGMVATMHEILFVVIVQKGEMYLVFINLFSTALQFYLTALHYI